MSGSERDLILRAAHGDKVAFGSLYETYLEAIYRYIHYRISHEQEAEDLTEEVFLRAWKTLPRMKKESEIKNFRSWIYRIARNLVIDHYRKKDKDVTLDHTDNLQGFEREPDEAVIEKEVNVSLRDAVQKLDEPFKEVLIHRFVNGLSHAETSKVMGLKENHIRVLQYRALKKVRAWMEAGGME